MVSPCVSFWAFLFLFYFSFPYFGGVFTGKIIPLALVGYEMIDSQLGATLYARTTRAHLKSNARVWNNKYFQAVFPIFLRCV